MERIFVAYEPARRSSGQTGYHISIHYTDNDNVTRVLDATRESVSSSEITDTIIETFFSISNDDSPWGRVVFSQPELSAQHQLNAGQETLITGDNLQQYWERMIEGSQRANAEGYEYRPLTQNSNTAAVSIIDYAGLLRPTGFADNDRYYFAPGAGRSLIDPRSGVTPNPFPIPFNAQGLSDGPLHLNSDQTIEQQVRIRGGALSDHDIDVVYANAEVDHATISNQSGEPVQVHEWAANGSYVNTLFDPTNAFIWDQRTFQFDPDDNPVGDARDYGNVFDNWLVGHEFPAGQLAQFDAAALVDLSAAVERAAYRGPDFEGSAPSPLSFESNFNSSYDFRAGSLTINPDGFVHYNDGGTGFDVTGWVGGSSGDVDTFGLSFRFPTNIFDVGFSILEFLFSPIVLDIDGDGVEITPRSDSTDYFDVDGDNFLEQTAWAGPDDGLLMVEDGGNAVSLNEVSFARRTANPDDTDLEALAAEFDTNHDGLLGAGDARWGDFWVLRQSTGQRFLAHQFITSISLTSDHQSVLLPDGSRIHGFGTFTTAAGQTRAFADAALSFNPDGFRRTSTQLWNGQTNFANEIRYEVEDGPDRVFLQYFASNSSERLVANVVAPYDGYIGTNFNDYIAAGSSHPMTSSGGPGADELYGGEGNDVLDGGSGGDTIDGGGGDDTIYFDASDPVFHGGSGHDTGILTSNDALNIHLEDHDLESLIAGDRDDQIHATPDRAAYIDGRAGNDDIRGSSRGDLLVGSAGDDELRGDDGDDLLNGGDNADLLQGEAGDDAAFGGVGDDSVLGGSGNDTLDGGEGNDSLDGGTGNDLMIGGPGSDEYTVDDTGDVVVENASEGSDTVRTSLATYTIGNNLENLVGLSNAQTLIGDNGSNSIFAGSGRDVMVGNAGDDYLDGGAEDDQLDGGIGNDTMIGGHGHDTYYVDDASDRIFEDPDQGTDLVITTRSLELSGNISVNVDDLTLAAGAGTISGTGNGLDNRITGNASDNFLDGGAGNDYLDGGAGNDNLHGRSGDDTYVIDSAADAIDDEQGQGTDTIRTALAVFSLAPLAAYIENLTGTSDAGQTLTGESRDNVITAGAGNDILDGQGGNDTMRGGSGDDTYHVNAADVIEEQNGGGSDRVIATTSFTLPDFVEHLTLATGAGGIGGTGNAERNTIIGNASDNDLRGSGGDDSLYGGDSGDILRGGSGGDTLDGGTGLDTVFYDTSSAAVHVDLATGTGTGGDAQGDTLTSIEDLRGSVSGDDLYGGVADEYLRGLAGDDELRGRDGADVLEGGDGIDTLIGGQGNDTLEGGAGGDTYHFGVGYGNDIVREVTDTAATDSVRLVGLSEANVTLTRSGDDLLVTIASSQERLTVRDHFVSAATGVEQLVFDDVTRDRAWILTNVPFAGTAGNDSMTGTSAEDFMLGLGGDDTISGRNGNDLLEGDDGNDTLNGDDGNDTLRGGNGDDLLRGGAGNDIVDGGAGTDSAYFGGGRGSFTIARQSGNIVVTGDGTDSSFASIEFLQFSDRTIPFPVNISLNDIVWRHSTGAHAVGYQDLPSAGSFSLIGSGDYDADGDADLLWQSGTSVVAWELEAGRYVTNHNLPNTSSGYSVVASGDFNGDGYDDLLWRSPSSGHTVAWLIEDMAFDGSVNYGNVSTSYTVIGAYDLDADGDDDVLWRHTNGDVVSWSMQGGGIAGAITHASVSPSSYTLAGAGDFDNDGDADLFWDHTSSGANVIWEMQGGLRVGNTSLNAMGSSYSVFGIDDFTDNGHDDLLWRHTDGSMISWQMNNRQIASEQSYAAPVTPGWTPLRVGEFEL